MKHIWEQALQPKLIETFKRPFIIHQTVLTYGQGESLVAERIEAWEDALPAFIKLAYLPSPGRVRLRLTARGTDEQSLQSELKSQITQLHALIGDIIVGMEEDQTIEVQVGQILAEKGLTLAVAESCTGGKIAEMITAIAGSSRYFKGGIVAYTEEAKTNLLGVSAELLTQEGLVSEATALAMALGAQQKFQADFALATTGNAGPSAGDPKQALGTVCIALATPNGQFVQTLSLGQPREKVILRAATEALNMLFKALKN
jgi:nicotinamide-nucleotide amidase